jgi:translocation and assembly module TamB
MPVDDQDDGNSPSTEEKERSVALQSEGDEPLPPSAERAAERDADRAEPQTPQGKRRRFLSRRNAAIAAFAVVAGAVALFLVVFLIYRLGFIDRYLAGQIKNTFAEYGVRAEIKDFHAAFSPRTVEMRGIALYDSKSGQQLGKIDRLLATVRIEDMYALRLQRNVNLESLGMDGLELWVNFDEQGNSNLRNLHVPPPKQNERILFSYSTAVVQLNNAIVHYGDEQHNLSGEARNIQVTVQPTIPSAPAESPSNTVNLTLSNSTFSFDNHPVNNIDINARARVNQTRADIDQLTLKSPVMEAQLTGAVDDWRAMRYQMQVVSTVDLTQTSDIFQTGSTIRGMGNFNGTVTGEGTRYNVDGVITSDALAADGVRLKALNVTAKGSGDGKAYNIQGKAIAELLTAGAFQLNAMQLAGQVMGTGTDFKWLGDLRAAAARGPGVTIAGLILNDAAAELRNGVWNGSTKSVVVSRLNAGGAEVSGARVNGVKVQYADNVVTANAGSVQAGAIATKDARVTGVAANNVKVTSKDGATNVTVDNTQIGGVNASGVQTGSLNVAGVRLAILKGGRVEGTTGDINAGTVSLENVGGSNSNAGLSGKVEDVRLAHPVFVLEPSGRYRASADLSLGGGMLGSINLGAARANVVASNNQYQINNFTADVLNGNASGNAVISTARAGTSRINADFSNLDIGNLIGAMKGEVVPVAGNATGKIDLTFPGTEFGAASGTISTNFTAETGNEDTGRTPLNGSLLVRADRGLFNIERANLKTAASELTATGQFSFNRNESNLQVNVNSSDAAELQHLVESSGLLEDQLAGAKGLGIELRGNLAFNGTLRGALADPSIDGHVSLGSLTMNGRDLGALTTSLSVTPEEIRIPDGRLVEQDGGGITFALVAPRVGENNISIDATLDRANAGSLFAALGPLAGGAGVSQDSSGSTLLETASTLQSDLSGKIQVSGIPNAMNGVADLRFGKGSLKGEPFESIVARATFKDATINLENIDANFDAGRITASGSINAETQAFDLQARGNNIQLDRLRNFSNNPDAIPQLTGAANLEARASGRLSDFSSYDINFTGEGRDVTINGRPAGTLTLVGKTENRQLNVQFTTGVLGPPQVVTARVDLSNDRLPTTIETNLSGADLSPLFAILLPPGTVVRVSGRATGGLRVVGNLADEDGYPSLAGLRGTANFTELTVQVEDVQLAATSPLIVQFSSSEVTFEKTQFTGPGTNIVFGGSAAIGPGGHENLTVNGRLNLRVLNGLSPNIFLAGQTDVAVRVFGSFEDPRVSGTAAVSGASFATLVGDQRLQVSNVKGSLRFDANSAQIESLTGNLGGGRVEASGGAALAGFVPTRFRFAVHGDSVSVPYPLGFRSTADADLEISGSRTRSGTTAAVISGNVNLRRAEYTENIELADLINRRREASLTEGSGDSAIAASTQLDVHVEGRDALVVRNNLADLVGSVSLQLNGSVDDPVVSGRITVSRGTINFRNDRYDVTRALIDLPPGRGADPILNIQAEAEIRGYQVIVGLTGPLSQPLANIRSEPALPQQDVVSLITSGQLSSGDENASILGQSGLGTAASLLTDTLINAPAQRATDKLFGINRFEIDPLVGGGIGGGSPTARLTVGRQINKDLSITYSTNVTSNPNQVLALEYRLSNRMSFIAQYEQGPTDSFSSRNNNFSFEIRFKKRF